MKHIRYLLLWGLLIIPGLMTAQKPAKVCGEYTYYAEGNITLNEAKVKALEATKLEAIARTFGTVISQNITQNEESVNGRESTYFNFLSTTEVRGEWIEDIGEPSYDVSLVQDMFVVKCQICGFARELTNESVDFSATLLKNGTEKKFADTSFHEGDDMFLLFRTPVAGYAAVYLVDHNQMVYCLMPYLSNTTGQYRVEEGKDYIFFSQKDAPKGETVDEYTLTCDLAMEFNQIYVIFSPNPFTKANDMQYSEVLPRQLPYEDFQKWLGKCRKHDPRMGLKVMHIEIRK